MAKIKVRTAAEIVSQLRKLNLVGPDQKGNFTPNDQAKSVSFIAAVSEFMTPFVSDLQKKIEYMNKDTGDDVVGRDDILLSNMENVLLPLLEHGIDLTQADIDKLNLLHEAYGQVPFYDRHLSAEYHAQIDARLTDAGDDPVRIRKNHADAREKILEIQKLAKQKNKQPSNFDGWASAVKKFKSQESYLKSMDNRGNDLLNIIMTLTGQLNEHGATNPVNLQHDIRLANSEAHRKSKKALSETLIKSKSDKLRVMSQELLLTQLITLAEFKELEKKVKVITEQSFEFYIGNATYDDSVYANSADYMKQLESDVSSFNNKVDKALTFHLRHSLDFALQKKGNMKLAEGYTISDPASPTITEMTQQDINNFAMNVNRMSEAAIFLDDVADELYTFMYNRAGEEGRHALSDTKIGMIKNHADWFKIQAAYLREIDNVDKLFSVDDIDSTLNNIRDNGIIQLKDMHQTITTNRHFFAKILNAFSMLFTFGKWKAVESKSEQELAKTRNVGSKLDVIQRQVANVKRSLGG